MNKSIYQLPNFLNEDILNIHRLQVLDRQINEGGKIIKDVANWLANGCVRSDTPSVRNWAVHSRSNFIYLSNLWLELVTEYETLTDQAHPLDDIVLLIDNTIDRLQDVGTSLPPNTDMKFDNKFISLMFLQLGV